ncbi:MAG: hypothetical protein OXS30_04875 [Chloroflexota bacterium]|nr:hypothetical protein [Chloroflexota bacterium]
MPNQFNLRARMDHLWRQSADHNPGYIRLRALGAIVRELYAPTEQARLNQQLCFATDPYDVPRHKLRDLYDREAPSVPAPERGPVPSGDELPEEDDDPL